MKRTPIARRTRLRPRSKARAVRAAEFAPVIEQAKRRDLGCKFGSAVALAAAEGGAPTDRPGDCWGPLHPHHILPRSRGGGDVLDNLVVLCAGHHQWVHEHPRIAKALGLLR